ncbi:hypothetical protein [Actinokineospora sp. HUAS TT18]|uniref:hypothetical protein n=1 Tax=Actinokineospora sp. HUAS TT18 TaxID=3447451 RepID=UPI003F5239E5
MSRAMVVSVGGLLVLALIVVTLWLWLRKRQKQELAIVVAIVALVPASFIPVLAKPFEDAWVAALGTQQSPDAGELVDLPTSVGVDEQVLGPGWGPMREMFTVASPAPYVTLNSITDNPEIGGDERQFLGVRRADSNCTGENVGWGTHATVRAGDYLRFRVYVENSAADNLDHNGSHTARGLRVRIKMPQTVGEHATLSPGQANVTARLTADNTKPTQIYYVVLLSSSEPVRLELVPGKSVIENNHFAPGGLPVPDSFLHDPGMLLGYDSLDGSLPPGYRYDLYFSFCVRAV